MYLLPQPQKIEMKSGFLQENSFCIKNSCTDPRIEKALQKLPCCSSGTVLEICHLEGKTEGYTLEISEHKITITGESAAGAFYAVQTLRQLLDNGNIPCLIITDAPGFAYRGFYHDVTRGKIPNMETLKALIDQMAYYKMNSLQLYVEHTFPFKEFGDYIEKNGYLTPDEIRELDDYCYENFEEDQLYWHQRMAHHTIDPTKERSIEIVKSMIDQYIPLFRTNKFNICCDETFDLTNGKHKDQDTGRLYIDFVMQYII